MLSVEVIGDSQVQSEKRLFLPWRNRKRLVWGEWKEAEDGKGLGVRQRCKVWKRQK